MHFLKYKAKGIGFIIAETVAKEGTITVIIGRKQIDNRKAIDLIVKNDGKVFVIEVELTKPEACEKPVQKVITEFGKIDGLVKTWA